MDCLRLMSLSETRTRQDVWMANPTYQALCTGRLGMHWHKRTQLVKIPKGCILCLHRLKSQLITRIHTYIQTLLMLHKWAFQLNAITITNLKNNSIKVLKYLRITVLIVFIGPQTKLIKEIIQKLKLPMNSLQTLTDCSLPSTLSKKAIKWYATRLAEEMRWAYLTPVIPVLVLITRVIHRSKLHFAVARSIVY